MLSGIAALLLARQGAGEGSDLLLYYPLFVSHIGLLLLLLSHLGFSASHCLLLALGGGDPPQA